jgi:hypothetical protein
MTKIKRILMLRDKMTPNEAEELISQARGQLEEYLFLGDIESAENICSEYFGLEPDYIEELY